VGSVVGAAAHVPAPVPVQDVPVHVQVVVARPLKDSLSRVLTSQEDIDDQ